MTIVGTVDVVGRYDGRQMNKGFKKSSKATKAFSQTLGRLKYAIGGALAGFTAMKAFNFAGKFIATGDALSKTSRRLGVTIEQMQVYNRAALLGGLSTEEMAKALEKLNEVRGKATMGGKTQLEAFARLSLSASAPLELILKRLMAIEDIGERTALARVLLGKSGTKALELASADFTNIYKTLKDTNQLLSTSEGRNLEEISDKWLELTTKLEAFGGRLVVSLGPGISKGISIIERYLEVAGILGGGDTSTPSDSYFAGGQMITAGLASRENAERFGEAYAVTRRMAASVLETSADVARSVQNALGGPRAPTSEF